MEVSIIFFFFIILFAICMIPMIFFLLHLHKLLTKCSPENREMEPGLVWLNLIPLFGWGWIFYTIFQVRDALKAEFAQRGLKPEDPQFSHPIGLAYCITSVCGIIPFIGFFSSIACIVLFIIYWVKTHGYSKQLD